MVRRVGFLSTRLAGIDGVSLETEKWAEILERMGFECYYIAGESDRPADRTRLIDEAHFDHPKIREIDQRAFGSQNPAPGLAFDIIEMARLITHRLDEIVRELELDVIVAENCLTIPMNIPLGVAIVRLIREVGIPCIAHHHDFYWERHRFLVNTVDEFMRAAFPPLSPRIHHVVINSMAAQDFSRRTGVSCRVIPNVMDFENPPHPPDAHARGLRQSIGVDEDALLLLQPTRVVARKGIEMTVEMARRLRDRRATVVITHPVGDEGDAYAHRIREYAKMLEVPMIWASPWFAKERSNNGELAYSLYDFYSQADLVTYPSIYEGFGNAFLEAVWARQPILCNRYPIYRTDIEPLGFESILMDGYPTRETEDRVREILDDAEQRSALLEKNYELGRKYFSYPVVERELTSMLERIPDWR